MENNHIEIKYIGENVKILKFFCESNEQFNKRLDYIKKIESKKINWKEAHRLSKIWYCINFKKCQYPSELYNKVMSYT